MKIDKKKLVELLVEKTGMKKETVEEQLEQLVKRILDAAERGKALEIKELGMFYFDQDGNLKFEVAEELSTEISFRYAGMTPLELKPERDPSIVLSDSEASETIEPEDKVKQSLKKEPVKAGTTPSASPVKKSNEPKKRAMKKEPKTANRGPIVLIAVVLLLIAGALFFLLPDRATEPEPAPVVSQEQTPVEAERDQTEVIQEEVLSVAPDDIREQVEETVVSDEGDYGFRGMPLTLQGDVFSVVIHSMSNEAAARRTADQFAADGFRTFVTTRTIEGNDTWRVSLGQFPTIEAAVIAAGELPSPYDEQNFIQRLQ